MTFETIIRAATALIYPSECPLCLGDSSGHRASPVCDACFGSMQQLAKERCHICAKPLFAHGAETCGECMKERPHFKAAFCAAPYEGALREVIHGFKFSHTKRLAKPLAGLLSGLDLPEVDVVTAVPASPSALRHRGFNPPLIIARHLARARGLRLAPGLLVKKKDIPPQVGLSRAARIKNVKGAYGHAEKLSGQRVLLVDDVVTTGATASECAKALLRAGASIVYVAAPARAWV